MKSTVSIVVCTRNRAESLRETLASIARCHVPGDLAAELLVIDNGSTDKTSEVVWQASLNNMPVRHVYEPTCGQCYARNRGLREAIGEVFLFTDDDVRVPIDWIEAMCRPITSGAVDAMQGEIAIAPCLLREWMTPQHRFCLMELQGRAAQHEKSPFLIGANMAFSARILHKIPQFDVHLGPGASGFMDDTLFYLQAVRAGFRIGYASGCAVEHHFDPSRLRRDSQLKAARAHGQSTAWVMHHWAHERVRWRRLRIVKNALRLSLYYLRRKMVSDQGFDTDEIVHAQSLWAYLELGKLARCPRVYPRFGLSRLSGDPAIAEIRSGLNVAAH